jgi:hypothetical protein
LGGPCLTSASKNEVCVRKWTERKERDRKQAEFFQQAKKNDLVAIPCDEFMKKIRASDYIPHMCHPPFRAGARLSVDDKHITIVETEHGVYALAPSNWHPYSKTLIKLGLASLA